MLPAENVHILCAQVNYATSEELVEDKESCINLAVIQAAELIYRDALIWPLQLSHKINLGYLGPIQPAFDFHSPSLPLFLSFCLYSLSCTFIQSLAPTPPLSVCLSLSISVFSFSHRLRSSFFWGGALHPLWTLHPDLSDCSTGWFRWEPAGPRFK